MSYPGAPPYGYQDRPRGGYGPRRGNHHGPPSNYRGPPHGHQPPPQHHQRPSGGQGQEMFGVFVGDLPPEADEQDLELLFSKIGPVVKSKVIRDAETSRSKRYGFVHFASEALQQKAIAEMHGQVLKGQTINVRTQHYKESDKCLVKPGTKPTDIYIGNIPRGLTKFQIKDEVSRWGIPQVKEVRSFKNDSGAYCFISFETEAESATAMNVLKEDFPPRFLAGRSIQIQGSSGGSSGVNTNFLNAGAFTGQNIEQMRQQQNINSLKEILGGGTCPLEDRQLVLLEKSQRTLYIRSIPPNTTESALNEKFSKYGVLKKVIIVPCTKEKHGYAFVEFMNAGDCAQASLQDDCQLHGAEISIQVSRPPKEVYQILSSRGYTDSSGNLLPQFTPQTQNSMSMMMNSTSYFQDPTTGQLFMGETQHSAHYIASGYIQIQPSALQNYQQQQQQQQMQHQQMQQQQMQQQMQQQQQQMQQQQQQQQQQTQPPTPSQQPNQYNANSAQPHPPPAGQQQQPHQSDNHNNPKPSAEPSNPTPRCPPPAYRKDGSSADPSGFRGPPQGRRFSPY